MKLRLQKKLAAQAAGVGETRVKLNFEKREDIKEAITKADIRELIEDGDIKVSPVKGVSRHRARQRAAQQRKGRQRGPARRKGRATARTKPKNEWMTRIRLQRTILKRLRDSAKISTHNYRLLYRKAKGGFFRSKKHLTLYVNQQKIINSEAKKK